MLREFLRFRFLKQGDIRFTSHRDLMRLYMRVLRRAALPLAMSKGFNPRPRISIPAPIGVGITGYNEVLDLELCRWCRPEEVRKRINEHLPEGLSLVSVRIMDGKPARRPDELCYRVALRRGHPVRVETLSELQGRRSVKIARETGKGLKQKDIAPFIRRLRLEDGRLLMLLKVTDRGTARPEEVLDTLGCEEHVHYLPSRIERMHVSLSSSL